MQITGVGSNQFILRPNLKDGTLLSRTESRLQNTVDNFEFAWDRSKGFILCVNHVGLQLVVS